jgi:hypothetical protein
MAVDQCKRAGVGPVLQNRGGGGNVLNPSLYLSFVKWFLCKQTNGSVKEHNHLAVEFVHLSKNYLSINSTNSINFQSSTVGWHRDVGFSKKFS